jgi:hypothetical protein
MSEQVRVEITGVNSSREPPGATVSYRVRNESAALVWLVNDRWLIWRQEGARIEISLARGRMQPGSEVFGYFAPAVLEVEPGGDVSDALALSWPLSLDPLWNERSEVAPPPGRYELTLRVGYGLTPSPGGPRSGEGVEERVFRWQREAVSDPFPFDIEGAGEAPHE